MNKLVIQETTIEGQRWDSIALKAYGDATMMNRIIRANPDIPITDTLPGGYILTIEIIDKADVKTDAEKLPPWKR